MKNMFKEYKVQKKLLLEALVEKDYLEIYESSLLKKDFVLKLGEPRYELHKLEMSLARTKLKLDMMDTCARFQIPVDQDHIDKQLEKEFEKHEQMLGSMKYEIERAHTIQQESSITSEILTELKRLYFSVAGYIHPEISTGLDKGAKRLWKEARQAFEKGNIAKLQRIHQKVTGLYAEVEKNELDAAEIEKVVNSLKSKTFDVLSEIENLKKEFPFNEAKILGDEAAVTKFRNDMYKDIKTAREALDKLEKQILEKLPAPNGYLN